jgi:hypothetical protein
MTLTSKKLIAITAGVIAIAVIIIGLAIRWGGSKSVKPIEVSSCSANTSSVYVKPMINKQVQPPASSSSSITKLAVDVDAGKHTENTSDSSKPSEVSGSVSSSSKKPPVTENNTVSTESTTSSVPTKGGVISVTPVPIPVTPAPVTSLTPRDSDWTNISPDVPKVLYQYNYTATDVSNVITGQQMEDINPDGFQERADAAKNALEAYYNIDYRTIGSPNWQDKGTAFMNLIYWCGESPYLDISDYLNSVVSNKIIAQAEFITDKSLTYCNGIGGTVIRGRLEITFTGGAESYGLQNNVSYYNDLEVAIGQNTGEDRYGFGQTNEWHALLFADDCLFSLSNGFKPLT